VKGERDGIGERETKKTTEVLAHREREGRREGAREREREEESGRRERKEGGE
jgi:hypothetical protein